MQSWRCIDWIRKLGRASTVVLDLVCVNLQSIQRLISNVIISVLNIVQTQFVVLWIQLKLLRVFHLVPHFLKVLVLTLFVVSRLSMGGNRQVVIALGRLGLGCLSRWRFDQGIWRLDGLLSMLAHSCLLLLHFRKHSLLLLLLYPLVVAPLCLRLSILHFWLLFRIFLFGWLVRRLVSFYLDR